MSDGTKTSTRNTPAESSREVILAAVRRSRPPEVALPEIETASSAAGELADRFMASVEAAAGTARKADVDGPEAAVAEMYADADVIAGAESEWRFDAVTDHEPQDIDVLVCRATFGGAENGAVWLYESQMGVRAAPYLAQHLVLVVEREEIVADMHAAYARLKVDAEGFGAFIAGPSKTADIEQSLVIGAHGPRSLVVLVVG